MPFGCTLSVDLTCWFHNLPNSPVYRLGNPLVRVPRQPARVPQVVNLARRLWPDIPELKLPLSGLLRFLTFSSRTAAGRLALIIRATSKNRVPCVRTQSHACGQGSSSWVHLPERKAGRGNRLTGHHDPEFRDRYFGKPLLPSRPICRTGQGNGPYILIEVVTFWVAVVVCLVGTEGTEVTF